MKKLIAISVMFALFIGAAFADTTVGGAIFIGGSFLVVDNVDDATENEKINVSHGESKAVQLDNYNTVVKLTFGDNDAGGWLSMHNNNGNYYHWFGWWRPIPQLRLQIGRNTDGDFGTAQISGWGFNGEAKNANGYLAAMGEYGNGPHGLWCNNNIPRNTGWYLGTESNPNFQASIFAIEGLTINFWVPLKDQASALSLAQFNLQAVYRLSDIGRISLSYKGETGYLPENKNEWWSGVREGKGVAPSVYLSFCLDQAIENIAIDLGVAYWIPEVVTYGAPYGTETVDTKRTTNYPVEIGLGFRAIAGNFTFKLRGGIEFGGNKVFEIDHKDAPFKKKTIDNNEVTKVAVNILPSYKFDKFTVYFGAGLGIQSVGDWKKVDGDLSDSAFVTNESSSVVEWYVNPYLMVPAGSLRFFVGLQLSSDGVLTELDGKPNTGNKKDGAAVVLAIPMGFYCYF